MSNCFNQPIGEHGFITAAELLATPKGSFLIDGLLSSDALAAVYGPSGTGKSFLVLDMMAHIGCGRDWAGRQVQHGTVVYVYGEGANGLSARVAAWQQHRGVSSDEHALVFAKDVTNLGKDDEVNSLIKRLEALKAAAVHPVRLVVFDTLARCMVGVEENSNTDIGRVVANADRIGKALGCAILLVHHTGKAEGNGLRGGSALLGALDTSFALTRKGKTEVRLEIEKQKDGPDGLVLCFERKSVALGQDDDSCVMEFTGMGDAAEASEKKATALTELEQAALKIIMDADGTGQGVPWSVIREKFKDAGTGRSSGPSEMKKQLIEKKKIREEGDMLILIS